MKQIIISIRPEWVAKELNGEKIIEIRKTIPQEIRKCLKEYHHTKEIEPMEVFIYCCKSKKKLFFDTIYNKYMYGEDTKNDRFDSINGTVVAKFILNKADIFECNNVPYSKDTPFGYGYYLDIGVYFNPYVKEYEERNKPYKCDNGLVFERKYTKKIEILKNEDFEKMKLTPQEIFKYLNYSFEDVCLYYIDNLQIFNQPIELNKFKNPKTKQPITKAPQSWCYCEYEG